MTDIDEFNTDLDLYSLIGDIDSSLTRWRIMVTLTQSVSRSILDSITMENLLGEYYND